MPPSPPFVLRSGSVLIHVNGAAHIAAVVQAMQVPTTPPTLPNFLESLAVASARAMTATATACCDAQVRSLRGAEFRLRGRVPLSLQKCVKQVHFTYSLARRSTTQELLRRVGELEEALRQPLHRRADAGYLSTSFAALRPKPWFPVENPLKQRRRQEAQRQRPCRVRSILRQGYETTAISERDDTVGGLAGPVQSARCHLSSHARRPSAKKYRCKPRLSVHRATRSNASSTR